MYLQGLANADLISTPYWKWLVSPLKLKGGAACR